MAIKVRRDERANAVIFEGASFASYWNGLLSASAGDTTDTVNVKNTAATSGSNIVYEYYEIPYTQFQDSAGSGFASVAATVQHINDTANTIAQLSGFESNQTGYDTTGTTFLINATGSVSHSFVVTGSSYDFNTYNVDDVPNNFFSTASGLIFFDNAVSRDTMQIELDYIVNADVANSGHFIKIEFTDNNGDVYSKSVTNAAVNSADEDVSYLTTIPVYVGDDLITSASVTSSAELFIQCNEDSEVKVKAINVYLTR